MPNHFDARVTISRLQRLKLIRVLTLGVAPGYHISRPWRWGLKF